MSPTVIFKSGEIETQIEFPDTSAGQQAIDLLGSGVKERIKQIKGKRIGFAPLPQADQDVLKLLSKTVEAIELVNPKKEQ